MKKSDLKQLIREVIEEFSSVTEAQGPENTSEWKRANLPTGFNDVSLAWKAFARQVGKSDKDFSFCFLMAIDKAEDNDGVGSHETKQYRVEVDLKKGAYKVWKTI
jgi:hypothetical protein